MNENTLISALSPGDRVTGFYAVRSMEIKTRRDGSPFLTILLGDRSGRIPAAVWENAAEVFENLKDSPVVKVMGTVTTYQDAPQMTVEKIRAAGPDDRIDPGAFVPAFEGDMGALVKDLDSVIQSVGNPHLRRLLGRIFGDGQWRDRFIEAPGGKNWHHAYLGGLLEHTLAVVRICDTMSGIYPEADRDLLIAGALLHDFGKIEEYGFKGAIDFTDEGRLWGHISIGAQRVRSFIEELEAESPFPPEMKKKLIHLILSHQGELEHGSPVLPQILEAMILYYADEMDAKANALKQIMRNEAGSGREWSTYIRLLDRYLYLKRE